MNWTSIVCKIWILHMIGQRCVIGQEYFMASFQNGLDASSRPDENVWLQFLNEVHASKEFTVCNWVNIKYFNYGIAACLWSYCTVESYDGAMECLQVCLYDIWDTANRNLKVKLSIPSRKGWLKHWAIIPLKFYHRRTWNHLCWSLSTLTGSTKFYHNGAVIWSKQINNSYIDFAMKGSYDMYDASFIFGQEPDMIAGGFDRYEAFIGDLSEFNVWNYTLTEPEIYSMAACNSFQKGNVISCELNDWIDKDKFNISNVVMTRFSDSKTLCNVNHRFVIFPERVQYPVAKYTCKIHGGSLAVPHSEMENQMLMNIVERHKDSCIKDQGPAIEKLAWIGAEQLSGIWNKVSLDTHHWSDIS